MSKGIEKAKARIAEEKIARTGVLDLSDCGLTHLEKEIPELAECTWLEKLDLSRNLELENIDLLSGLSYLIDLNLSFSIVKSIAPISRLKNLKILDLSWNTIVDIDPIASLLKLTDLNLLACRVEAIDPIVELKNLQKLNLSGNSLQSLSPVSQLKNLTALGLEGINTKNLDPIAGLTNLTELYFSGNKIKDLNPLARLKNLAILNFDNTKVENLNPIAGLTNLTELYFSETKVKDLNPIASLIKLSVLFFRNTKVKSLAPIDGLENLSALDFTGTKVESIEPITKLTNLTELYLADTKVKNIEGISNLLNLTALDFSSTQVENIEPIANLTNITGLNLADTKVKNIEGISTLLNLTALNFSHTQVENIEPIANLTNISELNFANTEVENIECISNLLNLEELEFSFTKVESIHPIVGLTNLKNLYFRSCRIQYIEPISRLNLKNFNASGNPLKDTPIPFLINYNSVNKWFRLLAQSNTIYNIRVPLMILGNGSVGKSSLLYALKNDKCTTDLPSTHAIYQENLVISMGDQKVIFNVRDFGGQELFHQTHQQFIHREGIKLIVADQVTEHLAVQGISMADPITGEPLVPDQLEYWVHLAGPDSFNSKTLVVQNKSDLSTTENTMNIPAIAATQGAECLQVSARTGSRISVLSAMLLESAQQLTGYGMPFPVSWLKAMDWLEQNRLDPDGKKTISKVDLFHLLENEFSIPGWIHKTFLDYLVYAGDIYRNDDYLGDTLILNLQWALDAIYLPFQRDSRFFQRLKHDTQGLVSIEDLFEEFGQAYSVEQKWVFLNFLVSCGNAFYLKYYAYDEKPSITDYVLFLWFRPMECPEELKALWKPYSQQSLVHLRISYPHRNTGMLHRIMVELGRKTYLKFIWRTGMIVPSDFGQIRLEGIQEEGLYHLAFSFPAQAEKILVSLINDLEEGVEEQNNWAKSTDCIQWEKIKDIQFYLKQHQFKQAIPLDELLQDKVDRSAKPFKLVISYAYQDRDIVELIRDKCIRYSQNGQLDFWFDQYLKGEYDPGNQIVHHFNNADGYILLVSDVYMSSEKKFIHDKEWPIIKRRVKEEGKLAYTLAVQKCIFVEELDQYNYFKDKTPVPGPARLEERDQFLFDFVNDIIVNKFIKSKQ